jgi:hypothetical protein
MSSSEKSCSASNRPGRTFRAARQYQARIVLLRLIDYRSLAGQPGAALLLIVAYSRFVATLSKRRSRSSADQEAQALKTLKASRLNGYF